jgi:hypothetical protein
LRTKYGGVDFSPGYKEVARMSLGV